VNYWWVLFGIVLVCEVVAVCWLMNVAADAWTDDYGAHIQAQLERRAVFDRLWIGVPDLVVTISADATGFVRSMEQAAEAVRRLSASLRRPYDP
jgi:hypothetical protein